MATKTGIPSAPPAAKAAAATLSKEEVLRYSRHLIMPEVGMDGQLKLKNGTGVVIDNRVQPASDANPTPQEK